MTSTNKKIASIAIKNIRNHNIKNKFNENLKKNLKNYKRKFIEHIAGPTINLEIIVDILWGSIKQESDNAIFDIIFFNLNDDLKSNKHILEYIERSIHLLNEDFLFNSKCNYLLYEFSKEILLNNVFLMQRDLLIFSTNTQPKTYTIHKKIKLLLDKIFEDHINKANEIYADILKGQGENQLNIEHFSRKISNSSPLTIPEVFIIESLSKYDPEDRHDGKNLYDLLRLSGKHPKYFYIQSKEELVKILDIFKSSKYRFLHISCHASLDSISLTDEDLSYLEFTQLCKGKFSQHRIFFSACDLGNELFVNMLGYSNKGQLHSLVAPQQPIKFHHAAAIWNAFYLSIFEKNSNIINSQDLLDTIKQITTLFPVKFQVATFHPKDKIYNLNIIPTTKP